MAKSSSVPKRSKIQYKYAIGIALKNCQPLLAKEICDFIIVHMPSICTFKNNNWQNAVRSNLSTCDWFQKIEVRPEEGKVQCFYKFAEGTALEEFHETFPIKYGSPYDFLTVPENYKNLYNGEMGYPTTLEIEAARVSFEQEQQRWSKLNGESRGKKAKKTKKEENFNIMVSSHIMIENENFGQYDERGLGPLRNKIPSTSGARMNPYERQTTAFREQNKLQVEPTSPFPQYPHNGIQQAGTSQMQSDYFMESNYQLQSFSYNFEDQKENNTPVYSGNYLNCNFPMPQLYNADYSLVNQFFTSPIVPQKVFEPSPNTPPPNEYNLLSL